MSLVEGPAIFVAEMVFVWLSIIESPLVNCFFEIVAPSQLFFGFLFLEKHVASPPLVRSRSSDSFLPSGHVLVSLVPSLGLVGSEA